MAYPIRVLAVGFLLIVGLFAVTTADDAGDVVEASRIKSAFLYNFAKFTDWPESRDRSPGEFVVCLLGSDPFGGDLERTVAGKQIRGHDVLVRRATPAEVDGCDMAFVGDGVGPLPSLLEGLHARSVLTVGDTPNFARRGGIVNFVRKRNRIRFEINRDAADRAGLRISSRLLSLAILVEDESDGN